MSWTRFGPAYAWEISRLLSAQKLPDPAVKDEAELMERWQELFPHSRKGS